MQPKKPIVLKMVPRAHADLEKWRKQEQISLLIDGASSNSWEETQVDVCAVEMSVVQPPISQQGLRGLAQHKYMSIILMNTSPRSCCPWSQ